MVRVCGTTAKRCGGSHDSDEIGFLAQGSSSGWVACEPLIGPNIDVEAPNSRPRATGTHLKLWLGEVRYRQLPTMQTTAGPFPFLFSSSFFFLFIIIIIMELTSATP